MANRTNKEKKEVKNVQKEELAKRLLSARENLRTKNFKLEGGKAGNVKERKFLRKHIARILTEINKK
jgi:ribosomal protein L29